MIFLVGSEPDVQRIPGHSWVLAESSPVFRAMFKGPLSEHIKMDSKSVSAAGRVAPVSDGPSTSSVPKRKTTIAVSDVDGRAFDILLR